jgi:MFS transporter, UMF1 family
MRTGLDRGNSWRPWQLGGSLVVPFVYFVVKTSKLPRGKGTPVTKQERSWVLYDWANSVYSMIITVGIFPIFFKTFVAESMADETSTAYWGYANTAAALVMAVMAPVLGALADREGNKMRLFLGFFALGLVSTVAMLTIAQGAWVYALVIYAISHIGFYGSVIFYDSFLVDVSKEDKRDWVSALGFGWGYIGGTIPFLIAIGIILGAEPLGFDSALWPTRIAFIITAVWWAGFSIPLIRNVRQVHFVKSTEPLLAESFGRLWGTFREAAKHRNIFIFLAAFFLYIDGVHTVIKMATSFAVDIGMSQNATIIALVWVQLVAFPCALLYGRLAKRFGAKVLLFVGVGTYAGITVLAFFTYEPWQFYLMATLVGSAQGGVQSLSRSLYSRLIPSENSAQFFGFYDIFGKFAAVLGPLMVGIVAQWTGDTRNGVLSLIVLFVVGGLLLTMVREESPEEIA